MRKVNARVLKHGVGLQYTRSGRRCIGSELLVACEAGGRFERMHERREVRRM